MEMEAGKLFIGGISWDTDEDRLREYFRTFGEVVEAVIMKDRATGRARGFGFVVFADPSVAERVVREKHMIDGRTVEAKKAVPRDDQILNRNNAGIQALPSPARTKKIFVGGLASTVTETDFKKYFDQFGTTTDVVVMYDPNTQRPRGFGFITYDSEDAVDKVLFKTFHELNGKMVEVKRAVPKEVSPGATRSPSGGYNYGLHRVSSFLNAYTQGYNSSSVGGYGVRMDERFSPVTVGRGGYPNLGPSSFGIGPNFEAGFSPNYEGAGSFGSGLGYGRALNTLHNGSSNRYSNSVEYGLTDGGSGFVLHSPNRSMWGTEILNHSINSPCSDDFMGSRSRNSGSIGPLGGIGAIWGSSLISGHGGELGSAANSGHNNYGGGENFESNGIGYGRIRGRSVAPTSSYAANDDHQNRTFGNFYGDGLFYRDPVWQSSAAKLDNSGSVGYGLRNGTSDVSPKNSVGYVGEYGVTNRATRGIAA